MKSVIDLVWVLDIERNLVIGLTNNYKAAKELKEAMKEVVNNDDYWKKAIILSVGSDLGCKYSSNQVRKKMLSIYQRQGYPVM